MGVETARQHIASEVLQNGLERVRVTVKVGCSIRLSDGRYMLREDEYGVIRTLDSPSFYSQKALPALERMHFQDQENEGVADKALRGTIPAKEINSFFDFLERREGRETNPSQIFESQFNELVGIQPKKSHEKKKEEKGKPKDRVFEYIGRFIDFAESHNPLHPDEQTVHYREFFKLHLSPELERKVQEAARKKGSKNTPHRP